MAGMGTLPPTHRGREKNCWKACLSLPSGDKVIDTVEFREDENGIFSASSDLINLSQPKTARLLFISGRTRRADGIATATNRRW
jgi:hypothetical protein